MKPEDLVSLITSNPQMLSDMKQEELCEISGKINPFSKNVAGEDKYVAFSFVNTRLQYLKTLQTISVSKFLKKLCEPQEIEEWGA